LRALESAAQAVWMQLIAAHVRMPLKSS